MVDGAAHWAQTVAGDVGSGGTGIGDSNAPGDDAVLARPGGCGIDARWQFDYDSLGQEPLVFVKI